MKTQTIKNLVILISMFFFSTQLIGQTINTNSIAETDSLNMKYEFVTNNSIITVGEVSLQMISGTTKTNSYMSDQQSQSNSKNSIADLSNEKPNVDKEFLDKNNKDQKKEKP